ncbi:hypothetical protein L1887_18227 [Cichorium endivia]|nr:hypothetical protein L1887_18227 [Cichorium endivia]
MKHGEPLGENVKRETTSLGVRGLRRISVIVISEEHVGLKALPWVCVSVVEYRLCVLLNRNKPWSQVPWLPGSMVALNRIEMSYFGVDDFGTILEDYSIMGEFDADFNVEGGVEGQDVVEKGNLDNVDGLVDDEGDDESDENSRDGFVL